MNENIIKNTKKIFAVLLMVIGAILSVTQLKDRFFNDPEIEVFKENIYLTDTNIDTGLIDFLKRNDGKTVYIDNFIDTSLATEENWVIEKQCGVDIDSIVEKKVEDTPLLLPVFTDINSLVCTGNYLVLDIGKNTTYKYSAGGTGVVMVRFKGFFEVSTTFYSGPSTYYHLKEVEVPYEVREKIVS